MDKLSPSFLRDLTRPYLLKYIVADIDAHVVPFQQFFGITRHKDVCTDSTSLSSSLLSLFELVVVLTPPVTHAPSQQKALELWEDKRQPLWKRFIYGLFSLYFSVRQFKLYYSPGHDYHQTWRVFS